ncbi:unnamed protein product [Arabidopsis thaliana]|uniref:F-box domain-containing protein n=1 Tax=Arabidopsis thaliana TaxID=3702 RepID=A0A5S9XQP4_ARATH|nr:unnamed protein product [Arabidopsis thaliana]
MTTMINNLPRDLIEEIISRVPLKSMKAVRLTCKTWNNLFKSEGFTKMHIGKVTTPTREGETMMIMMMPHKLCLVSGVVDFDPSIEVKGQLFLHNQVSISKIFHFEGLLLCILKDDVTRVLVWNPYWGQTRWINLRYSQPPNRFDRFSYALGYEDKESCRSLKFLRERFGPLLPLPCSAVDVTLSCVKEEKLAALFQRLVSELEIWITTKIDAEMVSWSKLFRIDTRPKIKKSHSFFVDEEKKVFMGFGRNLDPDSNCLKTFISIVGEDGYLEKLNLVDGNCKQYVISYIPSLVQIKEGWMQKEKTKWFRKASI